MQFVIVTGLSGAGKTQTIRCLEDIGFFCIDNLPPALIPKFAELCYQSKGKIDRIAIVVDIRGRGFFDNIFASLKSLEDMGLKYEIIFLDAQDDVLIKRFKESRRNHPLSSGRRIEDAILDERKRLEDIKSKANHIIDTSRLSVRQLKEEINKIYIMGEKFESLIITVTSFGFKYGIPLDCDLVFDARFIPNPYYIEELKRLSGNDKDVYDYVFKWDVTNAFVEKTSEMLEFLIPNYIKEGKSQLVIGIGCTGGRHRSVAIANKIYENLKSNNHTVLISHRDITKDLAGDGK